MWHWKGRAGAWQLSVQQGILHVAAASLRRPSAAICCRYADVMRAHVGKVGFACCLHELPCHGLWLCHVAVASWQVHSSCLWRKASCCILSWCSHSLLLCQGTCGMRLALHGMARGQRRVPLIRANVNTGFDNRCRVAFAFASSRS
jgi:hypothetical protein